jgi:hypothetical protein
MSMARGSSCPDGREGEGGDGGRPSSLSWSGVVVLTLSCLTVVGQAAVTNTSRPANRVDDSSLSAAVATHGSTCHPLLHNVCLYTPGVLSSFKSTSSADCCGACGHYCPSDTPTPIHSVVPHHVLFKLIRMPHRLTPVCRIASVCTRSCL